jgi:hypothetical protein
MTKELGAYPTVTTFAVKLAMEKPPSRRPVRPHVRDVDLGAAMVHGDNALSKCSNRIDVRGMSHQ